MLETMMSNGTAHAAVFSGVGTAPMSFPAASWRTSPSLRLPSATARWYSSLVDMRSMSSAASGVGANLERWPSI
jgi:hypothetical protein